MKHCACKSDVDGKCSASSCEHCGLLCPFADPYDLPRKSPAPEMESCGSFVETRIPLRGATDDNVNHPMRYTKGKIECIDAIDSAVVGKPPDEAVCVANVIKYLWRYEEKESLRSLQSAEWYLKRLIGKIKTKQNKE